MVIRAPPVRKNAPKGDSPGQRDSGASEVDVVGQGPVELEVGDGVGLGGVESGRLIEEPGGDDAPRWSAGGREGRGVVGEALTPCNGPWGARFEVEEDGGDDGRIGQERQDPHLAATRGTEQWQHAV